MVVSQGLSRRVRRWAQRRSQSSKNDFFYVCFPVSMADFHSLLLEASFSHEVLVMLNACRSDFSTSRKRNCGRQAIFRETVAGWRPGCACLPQRGTHFGENVSDIIILRTAPKDSQKTFKCNCENFYITALRSIMSIANAIETRRGI